MATEKISTLLIPLLEVESEHCALIVDKGLSKIQNISTHRVELNNHRAVLETIKPQGILKEAVTIIRELGYQVPTVKQTFPVLLMTCASCANSVESIVKAQAGVVDASVNFANTTLNVEYIPDSISTSEIQKAIQSIGYDLLIESKTSDVTIENIQAEHLHSLKIKTIGAVLFSVPVFVIAMFFMEMPYANEVMWVLSTPVILWFGKGFFLNAWKQAKHGSANMDTLVALSTGVAYIFSVFNTLFPEYWNDQGLDAHVYFEAASVVIAFILLGKLLEEGAKGNTSSAIKKLMGLQAKTVTILHDGKLSEQVPIENVKIGNILLVKPGEKIAVDGKIVNGNSYVDESMLSGEPIPIFKQTDDKVFAGTINQKGSFQFEAEKVGSETVLSHIIQAVQNAQGSKAPVQKLVDKIAGIFVPLVIVIAVLSFILWNLFGGALGFTHGLMALVTVLIIACPCALGLATPTAIMVGIGKAAEQGILIKNAESLELAKKMNAIILDKTGTITEGKPLVIGEFWISENERDKSILSSLEKKSEHPLADALVQHYASNETFEINNFESITGKGAHGIFEKVSYFVGNKKLMLENKIGIDTALDTQSEAWKKESKTVIWFANSTNVLGIVAIEDKIKSTSKQAIQDLKDLGLEIHMLTGDNAATAKAVSEKIGITSYQAEILPQEKANFVKKLQAEGKIVGMVGDGINDGTALAQADVSIAMGKGSDIAMDVAKMTILSSDLLKISSAIKLSHDTVATIKQNLFWAFIYNLIGIPIAAGVLYSFTGFLLNPMIAGAAMALSSVSVVSNSLRLKWMK